MQEVKEVVGASYRINRKIYYVSLPPLILLKEASKAIEDAVKATAAAEDAATAAAAAEDTPAEPSELDSDDKNDNDDDTYATFKDINDIKAIGVEDKGDLVLD